jgi:hypothetical protein
MIIQANLGIIMALDVMLGWKDKQDMLARFAANLLVHVEGQPFARESHK